MKTISSYKPIEELTDEELDREIKENLEYAYNKLFGELESKSASPVGSPGSSD